MGVNEGFDVYPALSSRFQPVYDFFLEEILRNYKDSIHPTTNKSLIRVVGEPGAEYAYIFFDFGEGAMIPYQCQYFLRFSSKIVSRDPLVGDYLREIYFTAKKYFPNNVEYWLEGGRSFLYHASESAPHGPSDIYKVHRALTKHPNLISETPENHQSKDPTVAYSKRRLNNFFSFVGEIRNRIYEELLVVSEPILIEKDMHLLRGPYFGLPAAYSNVSKSSRLWPALLRTNKKVHYEATSLLYSENTFILDNSFEDEDSILSSFLDRIGRQNASFLRSLCISFPAFSHCNPKSVALDENSIHTIELIRDKCTNIAIIETSLQTTSAMEIAIGALDNPKIADTTLGLVKASFKDIPSLKEIIINVYDEPPSDALREKVLGCGWTVKTTETVESDELFFSEDDSPLDHLFFPDILREYYDDREWEEEYVYYT